MPKVRELSGGSIPLCRAATVIIFSNCDAALRFAGDSPFVPVPPKPCQSSQKTLPSAYTTTPTG
eukprot:9491918-Pyramimonas_sp.AAC.1